MVYEIKKQDHILTENLQLQLKLAGKQLVGFGLIAASVVLGLALVTYSPADPSLFTATDRPVNNWIGSHGAMVASALIVVFGLGSWTLVVHLAMWGTRFLLNRNAGRFLLSFLMIPPAMLLASALAATGPTGLFAFNPGGLVGDVAYSGLLYAWWGEPAAAQRVLSLWVGGFTLLFGLSMLGFPIFRTLGHWLTLPLRALRPKPSKVEKKDSVKFAGSAEHSTHASHFDQQSDLDNHSKSEQGPTLRSRESAKEVI